MPHTIQIKRRKNKELNEIPIKDGELLFDKADENKLKIGVGTEDSASVKDINIGGAITNDGCFVGLDETNLSPTKDSTLITNDKTNGSIILTSDNNTTAPGKIDIKVDTNHDGNINIESSGSGVGVISISATKENQNSGVNIKSKSIKVIGTGDNAVVESRKVNGSTISNAPFLLVAEEVKHKISPTATAKTIIDTDGNVIADKDRDGNTISINDIKNGNVVAKKAEMLLSNNQYKSIADILLDLVYPVGSIYMSVNNASPETFLGGVWERWGRGRVPVGCDEANAIFYSSEQAGGSYDAVNVAHAHTFTGTQGTTNDRNVNVTYVNQRTLADSGLLYFAKTNTTATEETGLHSHTFTPSGTISSAGVSGTNKNLQPYITCYMWKRIE